MFETRQPDDSSGTLTITPDPHSGHPGRQAPAAPGPAADPGRPVPLERVEAQICELAGHLAAATCRFLVLLADFDARRGWASWDMNSCCRGRSPARCTRCFCPASARPATARRGPGTSGASGLKRAPPAPATTP